MRIKQNDLVYIQYYKIPKELIKNEVFEKISIGAKLLYGVMIDRAELSIKNDWVNENDEVFIYYKLEEIMQDLGIAKQTAINYLKELENNELIEKEKKEFNKPNKYYLSSIVQKINVYNLDHNSLKIRPQKSKNHTSIVYFLDPNNTEYNNTEYNNTEYSNTVVLKSTVNDTKRITKFSKPTIEEIQEYINLKNYSVNAEEFFNFYESKNWMIGKNKMSKWKSAVALWNYRNKNNKKSDTKKRSEEQWKILKGVHDGTIQIN